MKKMYWRCNGGHYFSSLNCPFDGWTSEELQQLNHAAERLKSAGASPSIVGLRSEGASESALRRAIVVEFGSDDSVFDAISPECYVIHNQSVQLHQAGINFH
jgi:hypothetical protein